MRIAMIGQKGVPTTIGGVERHVEELSKRLILVGHEVTVYSRSWYTGAKEDKKIAGITAKNIPSLNTKHFDAITHTFLSTLHAMKNSDVLHYHGVGPALLAWMPRLFTPNKKVVVTFHCIDRKHAKWGIVARFFLRLGEWSASKFAHELIAVSATIQLYLRDTYDRESHQIVSGVPRYTPAETYGCLNAYDLQKNQYVIAVSRLIKHKGLHYLIEAWQKLRATDTSIISSLKLVIIGNEHYTARYEQKLKSSIKPNDQIIFVGLQTGRNMAELYSHAKLLIHPSDNEGLPIAILEAMSYGLPVIASDIVEHREIIKEADLRFIKSDVNSLMEKLKKFLMLNEDAAKEIGKANKKFVHANFDWDDSVAKIMKYYKPLLKTTISALPSKFTSTAPTDAPGKPAV